MPNQGQINARLLTVAQGVAIKLGTTGKVTANKDGDQEKDYEGSWSTIGRIAELPILIFGGKYFQNKTQQRSVQFWAGLEARPNRMELLTEFLSKRDDKSFESIGQEEYADHQGLWLPTEQRQRWYRPHLDLCEPTFYVWFGRFFDANATDQALAGSIAKFLMSLHQDEKRQQVGPRRNSTETEQQRFTKQRIGQDLFRRDVLNAWNGRCCVSKLNVPELLRASHIKPWAACSNTERLDPRNGLPLSANLDALFDRGLIGFDKHGKIRISAKLSKESRRVVGISAATKLWSPPTKHEAKYLNWHLKYWKL